MNRKIYGLAATALLIGAGIFAQSTLLPGVPDAPTGQDQTAATDTCQIAQDSGPRRITADKFSSIPYNWDFSTEGNTDGWTFGADVEWHVNNDDWGRNPYIYISIGQDSITSPEIDLSGFDTPVLMYKLTGNMYQLDNRNYYISVDGQHWATGGPVMPKWAKYIRLANCSSQWRLDGLCIADIHTDEEWALVKDKAIEIPTDIYDIDFNRDGVPDGYYDRYGSVTVYESAGRTFVKYQCGVKSPLSKLYLTSNPEIVAAYADDYGLGTYRLPGFVHIDHVDTYRANNTYNNVLPLDVDNDGVADEYLEPATNTVYSIDAHGRIHTGTMPIMTLPEPEQDDDTEGGRNFVAWDYSMLSPGYIGSQMFGRDGSGGGGSLDGGVFRSKDVNGDGLTDHVNFNNGKVYFNIGNGKYYTDSFSGQMHLADFDGDGRDDYVLYNGTDLTLNIVKSEGGVEQKKIISGYRCTNIWTRDVDADGDPDIVLSLESGQKFIVVLENLGEGNFRRRENVVKDLKSDFKTCRDYDNDGHYEVITSDNKAYRLDGYTLASEPIQIAPDNVNLCVNPADGMTYCYSRSYGYLAGQGPLSIIETKVDTRPVPPTKAPEVIYEASTGLVKISWTAGSDSETPVTDLTYSLRVGSAPGTDDILTAYTTAEGSRYQAAEGNCGGALSRILDTSKWPSGTYYIAVQTVDGNYMGSEFSAAAVLTKAEPAIDFTVDYRPNTGIHTP